MATKISKNISQLTLYILVLLIASCSDFFSPSMQYDVEDASSPLLRILNCKGVIEFPADWVLSEIIVSQGVDPQDSPFASCRYYGKHTIDVQSKENYFEVYIKLISPTYSAFDQSILLDKTVKDPEIFIPTFSNLGKKNYQNCIKNKLEISCSLGVQYESSIIFLRFWVNGVLSDSQLVDILNPVLIELDNSLNSIN